MDIVAFNEASTANSRIGNFINNPDSASGIITVPKVIASGENITVPAGRVAVLPNVQIDGTLNIEGEVFIPSGATTADLDNRIGLKADTSYVNTQLSFKANTADLKEIGVGQTWQNVTASRSAGVTYTNSTGKPISVAIEITPSATNGLLNLVIDALSFSSFVKHYNGGTPSMWSTIIIPNNSAYSYTLSSASLTKWYELR